MAINLSTLPNQPKFSPRKTQINFGSLPNQPVSVVRKKLNFDDLPNQPSSGEPVKVSDKQLPDIKIDGPDSITDDIKNGLLDFLKPSIDVGRPVEEKKRPEYKTDDSGKIIPQLSSSKPTLAGKLKNLIIKPFVESVQDKEVRNTNIDYIQKKLPLVTKSDIEKNYDDLAYSMNITGPTPSKVMGDAMTVAAGVGLVANTVPTALALAGFGAISELDRFITAKMTKGEYEPFRSQEFHEAVTPKSASALAKFGIEMADFVAKGGALHGLYKNAPGVAEKLTKRKIERYNLPRQITIPAEAVKSVFGGELGKASPEQASLIVDLGLKGPEIKEAVKNGIDVTIPIEKIVTMGDRPWFKSLKQYFGVKESVEKPIFAREGAARVARKELAAPSEAPASKPETVVPEAEAPIVEQTVVPAAKASPEAPKQVVKAPAVKPQMVVVAAEAPKELKKIRHFTLKENVQQIIDKGFDATKPPIHGVKGLEAGAAENKFGKDVLYFTTDDGRWKTAEVFVGEGKGDISRKAYDYDNQKWINEKNSYKKVDLSPVEASVKSDAKVLTVDNIRDFKAIVKQVPFNQKTGTGYDGYNGMETLVAYAKEKGFDILNIKYGSSSNWIETDAAGVAKTDKYGNKDLYDQVTGKGGKDDYFVLNRDAISVEGAKTPVTKAVTDIKQGIVESKSKPSEVKASIIDKLEEALKTAKTEKELTGRDIPRGQTVGRGIRKESAMDDADIEALKKIPKLTFSIPGDGDFSIINSKEAISELISRVKKLDTSKQASVPAAPTGKSTPGVKFKFDYEITGTENEGGKQKTVVLGNLYKTPKGYVTNGKFLALNGELPKGSIVSEKDGPPKESMDKILATKSEGKADLVQFETGSQKSGEYATSADPIRTNLGRSGDVIRAVFDIGKGKDVFVNQNYILYFQENFKNPTYEYGNGMILVSDGKKRVGLIMPIVREEAGQNITDRISREDISRKEETAPEAPRSKILTKEEAGQDTKIDWMDNYTEALAKIHEKSGVVHPSEITHATFNGKAAGVKASEIVADLVRAGVQEELALRLTSQEFKTKRAPSGASASTGAEKLDKFEQTPSQDKTTLKLAEETVKIYKAVNDSLSIKSTLRQGNVSPNLGLTYHPTENISTVGLNAVSVNAHELAHRVDGAQKIIENVRSQTGRGDATRKALTDVYVKFYPGGKKNHSLRKRLTEGYATLAQKYLEQPTFMEAEYPALVREFLKPGGKYFTPATGILLDGFRKLIDRYQALDPLEKIGARVTEGQSGDVQKSYFSLKDKFDTAATNAFFPLEKVGAEAGLSGSANDPSLWAKMSRESKAIILTNINSDKGFWTLGEDGNFKQVSKDNFNTMVEKAEKEGVSAKIGWYLVARREVALLDEIAHLEKIVLEAQADLKLLLEEADPESMEEINSLRIVLRDAKKSLANSKAIFDKDGFEESVVRQAVDLYKKDFEVHPVTLLHDQFNNENIKLASHPLVMLLKPAAAEKMLSKKGYASFKREVYDELQGEPIIPATLQVGRNKISSMMSRVGSEKPILNPLYSAIINHAEIVKKSLKQIVYNKLVGIAKSGKFPELFQVEQLKAIPDARTGVIHYPQEKDTAIIMAREKFKRIPIRVDNYLKTAIDDMLTFQNFGIFEQLFTLPSKVFTISTTGLFIPFTLVNYVRDQITAVAQTKSNYTPVIDSIRMLISKVQNVDSPESKFMQEYFALGGEKNTLINIFDLSPEDALKVINGEKKGLERVGAFFEKIGSVLSAPANISETATRLTEYVRLRMEGKSQVAALDQAARITVPFKYKGSSKSFGLILRSVPYFSSSIQALRQAGRSGFGSKKEAARWWAVYSAVTAAIVASAYNTIHNASDEQKNQYKDLSAEELSMNIYWPARGGKGLHKIPINQEMGGVGAIISMAIAEMAGADYKAGDYISAGVAFLPRQIQPAEWQQMIMAWIPQIIKPAVSMATNTRDFPNVRPIEGMSQQWKEPRLRFTEATSGLAKWIGDKFNLSPIMVDFFMQGYIGRGATAWLDPMERMTIRPIQADKYYFEGGRRLQNFYNQKKQSDQQFSSLKGSPESYTDEQAEKILEKKSELEEINHLMKAYRATKKEGDDTEDLRAEIIALIDKI